MVLCGCGLGGVLGVGLGERETDMHAHTPHTRPNQPGLNHHTTHIRLPTPSTSSSSTSETPAPKLVLQPPPAPPAPASSAPAPMEVVDAKEQAGGTKLAAPTAMEGVTTTTTTAQQEQQQQRVTGEAARVAEAEATGEAGSEEEDFVAAELEVGGCVVCFIRLHMHGSWVYITYHLSCQLALAACGH